MDWLLFLINFLYNKSKEYDPKLHQDSNNKLTTKNIKSKPNQEEETSQAVSE